MAHPSPLPFATTHARTVDPDTSHEAARRAAAFAPSHKARILAEVVRRPAGASWIAHALGLEVGQVNKRLADLKADGAAFTSGSIDSRSGRRERVWVADHDFDDTGRRSYSVDDSEMPGYGIAPCTRKRTPSFTGRWPAMSTPSAFGSEAHPAPMTRRGLRSLKRTAGMMAAEHGTRRRYDEHLRAGDRPVKKYCTVCSEANNARSRVRRAQTSPGITAAARTIPTDDLALTRRELLDYRKAHP